ncbi:hypothetical protein [Maribacter sp. HTCC2170]|uniref:hypothetical protein n=1 Tax=Maribacter sp. (strain HTCC2170 / KCCM 42371) TaxID=313603 RepID=UPI00006B4945|nr:hypothetical protein [Maribacter sp. HTCC2170]EAR01116.1 hypothetical protein FB2170_10101 [Maribacter sp. HTCC2170]
MIGFLVPVKSEQLSSDWPLFSKLVDRSLKSINGQKDRDFQIIVACHELPVSKFEHPQVHYVQVDFDPPKIKNNDWEEDRQLKEGDKARKILRAFEYANQNFEIDYYMVVDSDDCIHNGISKYVNSRIASNIPGWVIDKGYFYREGEKMAWKIRSNFNVRCGTCTIIRKDLFKQLFLEEPYLYYFHEKTEFDDGVILKPLPIAGAIYSMANGENHFMSQSKMVSLVNQTKYFTLGHLKSVFSKITRYRPRFIGKRFKSTYNFYNIE